MSVRALVVVLQMTRSLPPPPAPLPAPCCHFHHLLARGRHRPRGSPSETSGLAWCPRIVKVTGSSLAGRSRHLTTSSIRLKPGRRHYHREINDSYLTGSYVVLLMLKEWYSGHNQAGREEYEGILCRQGRAWGKSASKVHQGRVSDLRVNCDARLSSGSGELARVFWKPEYLEWRKPNAKSSLELLAWRRWLNCRKWCAGLAICIWTWYNGIP